MSSNVTAIAAGGQFSLFLKSDGSLWAMGYDGTGQLGDGILRIYPSFGTNQSEQVVVNLFYNKISGQLLGIGGMQLSFVGIAGTNYALDGSVSPLPPPTGSRCQPILPARMAH